MELPTAEVFEVPSSPGM